MKRLSLSILLVLSATLLSAQNITGTWSGRADLGIQKLRIVFHIESDGEGYSAKMDSPDQGATGIPAESVAVSGDTCRISIPGLAFVYIGVLHGGDKMKGSFTQRGAVFPLDLEKGEMTARRPQEPRPPYPYDSEDIFFENKEAGIKLAGTLTCPKKGRRLPAVVMITGSGSQNRDEELFGHKPFLVIADHLTRSGIAVLRFDDRGFARSEGDAAGATSADFATDAYAAVEYLKTRKEIDPKKIGLAGHSEGGLISFIVAAGHPEEIAFVISLAGPGVNGGEITVMQVEDLATHTGIPEQYIGVLTVNQRKVLETARNNTSEYIIERTDSIAMQIAPTFLLMDETAKNSIRQNIRSAATPWFKYFISHEPAESIRRTKCPVLALNGGKDLQVRASVNLTAIAEALEEGGNMQCTTKEYPGLNHMFQHIITGSITEYGDIEETISTEVLEDMAAWILKVTK